MPKNNPTRIICGIDPGITGALAILNGSGVTFIDTPTLEVKSGKSMKHFIDANAAASLLRSADVDYIVIEKVWAMPAMGPIGPQAMGVTASFNFGMGFGIWLGIIAALQIPHEQVTPITWKKACMPEMQKEKDASRLRAMQLYPKAADGLNLKKHHNRADALLLAHYGTMR